MATWYFELEAAFRAELSDGMSMEKAVLSDWKADGGRDNSEQMGPRRAAFCVVAYMGILRMAPDDIHQLNKLDSDSVFEVCTSFDHLLRCRNAGSIVSLS